MEITIENALKIMIGKSSAASKDAFQMLHDIYNQKPIDRQQFNNILEVALKDSQAELTTDERMLLAGHLSRIDEEGRTLLMRVRLTESERAELQKSAEQSGMNMSEYVRKKLFSK